MKHIFTFLLLFIVVSEVHSQPIKQRLIAENTYMSGVWEDSGTYRYNSNYRGSDYNFNLMEYSFEYPLFDNYVSQFFNGNYQPFVACDNGTRSWMDHMNNVKDSAWITMHYNNKQMLTEHTIEFIEKWTPTTVNTGLRYVANYSNQYDISNYSSYYWDGTGWAANEEKKFYYNANGHLEKDTLARVGGNPARYYYHYNSIGQLDSIDCWTFISFSGVWKNTGRFLLSYNGGGKINRIVTQRWVGFMTDYNLDSFSYTAGADYFTSRKTYTVSNSGTGWDLTSEITKHVNAQHLPDTLYSSRWNDLVSPQRWDRTKTVFEFNAFNNPETSIVFNESSPGVWDVSPYSEHHYYYEEYEDHSGVKETLKNSEVTVFPNPNTGLVTIKAKETMVFYISNIQGQLLCIGELNAANNFTATISELPQGINIIRDRSGRLFNKIVTIAK